MPLFENIADKDAITLLVGHHPDLGHCVVVDFSMSNLEIDVVDEVQKACRGLSIQLISDVEEKLWMNVRFADQHPGQGVLLEVDNVYRQVILDSDCWGIQSKSKGLAFQVRQRRSDGVECSGGQPSPEAIACLCPILSEPTLTAEA